MIKTPMLVLMYHYVLSGAGFNYLYSTQAFGRNTTSTPSTHIHRFAVCNRPGTTLGKRIRSGLHPLIAPIFNGFKQWRRSQKGQR